MRKKRSRKGYFSRIRINLRLIAIILATVVVGFAGLREAGQKYLLDKERAVLEKEASEFEERNKALEKEIVYLQDPMNLETEVRRRLHLKKPWEHVIFFTKSNATSTEEVLEKNGAEGEDASLLSNPQRWLNYFFP